MASSGKLPFSNGLLKREGGLTLLETMVAIAVFGFLIVLCIGLFIFLGQIYYRGIYENRAQEVARTIADSVTEAIRTSGAEVESGYAPRNGWYAYCVGGIQYSYKLNVQLVAEAAGANQSEEVFIASRGCNDPAVSDAADPGTGTLASADKTELLSDRMRLLDFTIGRVGDNQDFYKVRIKIAVGGDASDLPHDKTVFEYINHPCDFSALAAGVTKEDPAPSEQSDCEDGADEIAVDDTATTSVNESADNGTWKEPEDATDNPIHTEANQSATDWSTKGPPEVIVHQCQDAETFCSVIEIETKVFRRVF